ncbi:hypothetical protein L4D76_16620 [Photobacterium sagamiensis]|uniref:hypothetical protein n=1 Tax=Photobacterium sagamiensis TaxID=2910241 RepID=UPI003D0E0DAB
MVSDLLAVSIQQFQDDCLQLCEQHYPTVHNRGMRENHLGKALCRRILATFQQAGLNVELQQSDDDNDLPQPIFSISSDDFTIWIIAHHLLSANLARREALVETIDTVMKKYEPNKSNHLLLVADHWFDRSKASKEIPAWWLGQVPENLDDYRLDGIRLLDTPRTLPKSISERYSFTEGQLQLHHPLKRSGDKRVVHKYIVLTAYYPI